MNIQTIDTSYRRKRTLSLTSLASNSSKISLDFIKAGPAIITLHTRTQPAYGSFTPIPSARTSLYHLNCSSPEPSIFSSRRFSSHSRRPSRQQTEEADSPLSSGTSSPIIPSFSRTASPPPMLAPEAFRTLPTMRPVHARRQSSDLHPILAKLEKKSKLLTKKVYCSTCAKPGADFPKCGRCEAMWCSRECRMYGGKRHVCSSPTSKSRR